MSLHIFSRRALPQWSSLAQLQTDMATGSYGRRGQALYQVGKEGDDSAVIGQWRYDGTVVRPIGPLDLTAAAWGYATVAGVVGAAVTVDASPTLGTSGTLRAWDVSAGASLGDVAYTRSGTAVTLTAGALAGLAAGDVLYEVVGGRTGALNVAAAGEIRPAAGASVQPRATGLYCAGANAMLALQTAGASAGPLPFVDAAIAAMVVPTVNGQFCGVGVVDAAGVMHGPAVALDVATLEISVFYGGSSVYGNRTVVPPVTRLFSHLAGREATPSYTSEAAARDAGGTIGVAGGLNTAAASACTAIRSWFIAASATSSITVASMQCIGATV